MQLSVCWLYESVFSVTFSAKCDHPSKINNRLIENKIIRAREYCLPGKLYKL